MFGYILNPKSCTFDLISLGECLVEFNRTTDGIFHPTFAGDAVNALFYAARLGLRTGFVSAVGDDLFTQMILDGIEREGIDTSHLFRLDGKRNGLYFIELDEHREYTFHFWRAGSAATETLIHHDLDSLVEFMATSRYVLLTGVSLAVLQTPKRLHTLLERLHGRTQIIFDTNYRARLWDSSEAFRNRVEDILPFIDIMLPTQSDLQTAWPDATLKDLCEQFTNAGVSTITIKAGAEGCMLWSDRKLVRQSPPASVQVVDTTGAGDAFNAGFITGLVREEKYEYCCELGQLVAAKALVVQGAINQEFVGIEI